MEPIRAGLRDKNLGLGKQEQDDQYTAQENVQRKKLETEIEETEEIAKKREVSHGCCAQTRSASWRIVRCISVVWCGKRIGFGKKNR